MQKLRTSTKSGISGIVTFALLLALRIFAPDLELPLSAEGWIMSAVMYVTARFSKTPKSPGIL